MSSSDSIHTVCVCAIMHNRNSSCQHEVSTMSVYTCKYHGSTVNVVQMYIEATMDLHLTNYDTTTCITVNAIKVLIYNHFTVNRYSAIRVTHRTIT